MDTGTVVPLSWYLILAAAIFSIGIYGVLSRRNLITVMMSIELMLNAVVLNVIAFARYLSRSAVTGQTFAILVYAIAAAEAAVGLALVISLWRTHDTVAVEEIDQLKG